MTRTWDRFNENPTLKSTIVTGDPVEPTITGSNPPRTDLLVKMSRLNDLWMRRTLDESIYRPYSEVCIPFNRGASNNLNDKTNYPLTESRASISQRNVISYNSKYYLLHSSEIIDDILTLYPTAFLVDIAQYGTVKAQIPVILGCECIYDLNDEIVSYGAPLAGLITGLNALPSRTNYSRYPCGQFSQANLDARDTTTALSSTVTRVDIAIDGDDGNLPRPNQINLPIRTYAVGDTISIRMTFKQLMLNTSNAYGCEFRIRANGINKHDDCMTWEMFENNVDITSETINSIGRIVPTLTGRFADTEELLVIGTVTDEFTATTSMIFWQYILGVNNLFKAGDFTEWGEMDIRINESFDAYIPTNGTAVTRLADEPTLATGTITDDFTIYSKVDLTNHQSGLFRIYYASGGLQLYGNAMNGDVYFFGKAGELVIGSYTSDVFTVIATRSNGVTKLYVDGTLDNSGIGDLTSPSTVAQIARQNLSDYTNLNDIGVYQKALSADQALSLHYYLMDDRTEANWQPEYFIPRDDENRTFSDDEGRRLILTGE